MRLAVMVLGNGGRLEFADLTEDEELAVTFYLDMYSTYAKLRLLKIPINPHDFDREALDVIYAIHTKLIEIDEAERKAKGGKK